jgi:hypothetical protein
VVSDGKQHPSSLLGNADNLSENFDARVKISRSFLVGRAADAILKVTEDSTLRSFSMPKARVFPHLKEWLLKYNSIKKRSFIVVYL